jgi:hypothetical protein
MILYHDGDFIIFKEDTVQTIILREQRTNRLEVIKLLIQDWSLTEEVTLNNIAKLKPFFIREILKQAIIPYTNIINYSQAKLKNFIRSTFSGSRVDFSLLEDEVQNTIYTALSYAQNMFDHRGNMVFLPFSGGIQEQPASVMHVLSVYRSILIEEINKNNKRKK